MKKSIFRRQSTWVIILLIGLAGFAAYMFYRSDTFKSEDYLPVLKSLQQPDGDRYYNLGFENVFLDGSPKGWHNSGYSSYTIQGDSMIKHSGKYALRIESKSETFAQHYGGLTRSIPAIYAGKNITLKAFMRTEEVDQSIGLLLRIDGNSGILQFDNMMQRGLTGTGEWQEYSVTLPLPDEAETIYIGAILSGKGKLWVDDFQLLIDDNDIGEARLKAEKSYLAREETEFDKGSKITIESHTPLMVTNLEILGRIWGYLKYYHPAVASGKYNWDAELFRLIPAVIQAQSIDERNQIFVDWIDRLGKIKPAKNKTADTLEVKLQPDFAWMEDPGLGKTLSGKLKAVKDAARSTEHYYIGLTPGIGSPIFKNENPYPEMKYYDDSGLRLLALFRYWNMIEYFFPYKHLTDKNWNTVLTEFIPVFLNGNKELDYKLAILRLIASVNDTQATIVGNDNVLNRWKGINVAQYSIKIVEGTPYYYHPERSSSISLKYRISFIEGKAVVTGISNNEPSVNPLVLKNGDIITHIDGSPIEEIIEKRKPFYPASNQSVQLRTIADDLLRTNDEELSLQIIRNGKPQTCKVVCSNIRYLSGRNFSKVSSHKFLSSDIGYIWPETLMNDSIPVIMRKFRDTKGVIIDFRCYPRKDFTAFTLGSYLTPQPTEFLKFTKGSIVQPGRFTFSEVLKIGDENNENYYKGKIIIIVNEVTQSSAEYHAMAFQTAPEAKVIGSITAAADGNVSWIVFPGNVQTMITGIGVYYPDGRETQRVGIALDMEVKPTIRGITEGRDELLEKAMEIINE
ncbi:MAG: peptidase S41 [Bacteroidales bacterium]|nr:peptidase S41 [Bacteroidales bacterium]